MAVSPITVTAEQAEEYEIFKLAEQAVLRVRPDLYGLYDSEIRATIRALQKAGMVARPSPEQKEKE